MPALGKPYRKPPVRDPYNPKTVSATLGRRKVNRMMRDPMSAIGRTVASRARVRRQAGGY
jgi:hypothetical protein